VAVALISSLEIEASLKSIWLDFKTQPERIYFPEGCLTADGLFDFDDNGRLYALPVGEQQVRLQLIQKRLNDSRSSGPQSI
jgi:hypothetical protein